MRRSKPPHTVRAMALLTRFDLGPAAVHRALRVSWQIREGVDLGHGGRVRVNARVVAQHFVNQRGGRRVAVRELHEVGDVGHHVWLHQVVEEYVSGFDVFRISRNGHHVEEATSTFFRDAVGDVHAVLGFFSTGLGLVQVARVADGNADVAVGQVADVLGAVEVRGRGTDREEQLFSFLQLACISAIRLEAQIVQRSRENFGWRVEEGHAALFQLGDVFRLEHQVPGVDRCVFAQCGFDLVDVVTDADGAPPVRNRVLVTRVAWIEGLEQALVEVFPVGQLGLVQLLEYTGLNLLGQERVGRHDDVITGAAGQQFGFQGFVAVKDVVDDLDAGFLLEVVEGVFCDVVGPVVNVQDLVIRVGGTYYGPSKGQREKGFAECVHAYSSCCCSRFPEDAQPSAAPSGEPDLRIGAVSQGQ